MLFRWFSGEIYFRDVGKKYFLLIKNNEDEFKYGLNFQEEFVFIFNFLTIAVIIYWTMGYT